MIYIQPFPGCSHVSIFAPQVAPVAINIKSFQDFNNKLTLLI